MHPCKITPLTLPSNVLCSMNNNSPGAKWSHPKLLKPWGTGFKNKSSIFYFYFAIAIGTGPRFLFLQFGLPKIPYSIRAQPKREYPDLDYRVQINVPSNCKSFTIWLGGGNLQNRKSQTAMIKRERQEQNKHKATNGGSSLWKLDKPIFIIYKRIYMYNSRVKTIAFIECWDFLHDLNKTRKRKTLRD